MNYLLHLDSSSELSVIAVSLDGKIISSVENNEQRNHAATINNLIETTLIKAEIKMQDLNAISVCGGPGSYMGLRISLATAKGICYALGLPLLLENKITLLAYDNYKKFLNKYFAYVVLLKARENEYFICIYDLSFNCILLPQHIGGDQIAEQLGNHENICLITDADENITNSFNIKDIYICNNVKIDIFAWANYSYQQFLQNKFVQISIAEPYYLKEVFTHN